MKLINVKIKSQNALKNLQIDESLTYLKPEISAIRFWNGSISMVIGRFQQPLYEVNTEFITTKNIPIFRRFSGGGTVYHDPGVMNMTLSLPLHFFPSHIQNVHEKVRFLSNIIFNTIKIPSMTSDNRGSLFFKGKKFLGAAAFLYQGRLLYHCSMLHNADLNSLNQAINWLPQYPLNTANIIESHRSPVININQFLNISSKTLIQNIYHSLVNQFAVDEVYDIHYFAELSDLLTVPLNSLKYKSQGVLHV